MSESPYYVLRLLCTIYLGCSLAVQWILTWIVQTIFQIVTFPFITTAQREDGCGHIFRFISFIGMDALNPFWRVHVLNKFPETESKKVILMMNHLSGADPFVAIRSMLPRDGSWIAKSGLFKVPFAGWAMANAHDLAVHFRKKTEGFDTIKGTVGPMMEEAREKLRRGRMICVFPEGVRNKNPDGPLNPFRLGFFTLAVEERAVIVPLAISGTQKLWPRGSMVMDSADAYFSFGEPIEAGKFSSAEQLSDHVRGVLTELRENHPDRIAHHAAEKEVKEVREVKVKEDKKKE